MKRIILMVIAFVLVTFSFAMADSMPTTLDQLLVPGATFTVDDKLFSDFTYASAAVPASAIAVSPDSTQPNNPGIIFSTFWIATDGQIIDSDIGYAVSVLSGGNFITDVSSEIAGVGTAGTGGTITLAENFFDIDGNNLANLTLTSTGAGVSDGLDLASPVTYLSVVKDLGLVANAGGSISLSRVENFTSESSVPEPSTLLLFAPGLIGLGFLRRKLRKNH